MQSLRTAEIMLPIDVPNISNDGRSHDFRRFFPSVHVEQPSICAELK